jgi:hypothetical protein
VNQRRVVAAAFFSALMVAVLSLIVYTERSNASQTVAVWILTRDVAAGAPYAADDVQQVQIRAQTGDFSYEDRGPSIYPSRYARNLSAHDILRSDDLVALTAESEIALTLLDVPPLNPGDRVDVYAALPSGQQALIGRDLAVQTVSGASITVLVPAADEASWIAVSSSSAALHAARTVAGARNDAQPLAVGDAIRILCGPACATPTSPPAATSSP